MIAQRFQYIFSSWIKCIILTYFTVLPVWAKAQTQVTVDGVIYEKSGTSSAIVKGLDSNTITAASLVNIQDEVTIDGYNLTVSGFGEKCFEGKSFTSIIYPTDQVFNFAPNCFLNATVKYLDLTQAYLTIDSDALKGCKITGKLTINNTNFDQTMLTNMGEISTLVCVDEITSFPDLSNVSSAIVLNNQVNSAQNHGYSVKGFGDVSGYPEKTFFSFVAGEDLYFAENGDVEAFVPDDDPLKNDRFILKKTAGIAKKGTALFLRIKENASNKVIPSANGQTTTTITASSKLKGQMKTWTPVSGKTYYAIHKTDNGYDGYIQQYEGNIIPPCVAVIVLDPSSQNNSAKSLQLTIGDGTTEIEELQDCEETNICFDLNGNPTEANAHGIIIINGKKIIRK